MNEFSSNELKKLYMPLRSSHKGQNGKLLLIGGSHLFHAASLWSLQIASKLVDMVFYSSVPENNQIVQEAKQEFRNGIIVPRGKIEDYVAEADCILIGPGMVRTDNLQSEVTIQNLEKLSRIEDEGEQTFHMTQYLLHKFPQKKWVIDGGALQMIEKQWLRTLPNVILTPHLKEFERVFGMPPAEENVQQMAKEFNCIILRKGPYDIVCSPIECVRIEGGNAGMTKGGTGDVLAGLVAALACKNDLFLAAAAGSYINKKAGDSLFEKVGTVYNSSDLVSEIPIVMKGML